MTQEFSWLWTPRPNVGEPTGNKETLLNPTDEGFDSQTKVSPPVSEVSCRRAEVLASISNLRSSV